MDSDVFIFSTGMADILASDSNWKRNENYPINTWIFGSDMGYRGFRYSFFLVQYLYKIITFTYKSDEDKVY